MPPEKLLSSLTAPTAGDYKTITAFLQLVAFRPTLLIDYFFSEDGCPPQAERVFEPAAAGGGGLIISAFTNQFFVNRIGFNSLRKHKIPDEKNPGTVIPIPVRLTRHLKSLHTSIGVTVPGVTISYYVPAFYRLILKGQPL